VRAAALVTCGALAGCSIIMTDRPKSPPQEPSCSTSYGPVVLDILGALTLPFVFAVAYVGTQGDDASAQTTGAILGVTFVGELISAGVGISRVSSCRRAYNAREYHYYQQQRQPPPQPQPQPQPLPPPSGGLGQVGDSCNIESDCATGLVCQSNRCARR
jgi:hypothetical protein